MAIKRPMIDMDKPRPKKMYLSGAITGRDRAAVERKFAQAEIELLAEGYIPISPLRNGLPDDATYEQHMERDLQMLCGCDAILMLPDWRDSPGAWRELIEAIRWSKDVYFFNPLTINNMETKTNDSKKYLQMGALMVALIATLVAFATAMAVMFPGGGAGVDWFHGLPSAGCAGYCAYLAGRTLLRVHNSD